MLNAAAWRSRAALMYTVGTWTVFGYIVLQSVSFFKRAERYEKEEQEEEEQQQQQQPPPAELQFGTTTSEDSISETITYGTPGAGFYATSTVKYKANFVPYTTRLYNYMHSFFDDSAKKEK